MHDGFSAFEGPTPALPPLAYTPEVEAETLPILAHARGVVSPLEWRLNAPVIARINRLNEPGAARFEYRR